MAMSTGQGGSNDKAYFAKVKGLKKGEKEIYFEVRTKEDGELKILKDKPTKIEGYLQKIELKKFEYEGKVHDEIKFIMKDDGEVYFVSFGMNSLSRGILNSLASIELFGKIGIAVYFNKAGFSSSFITNDGAKTGWKYDMKELNQKVEVIKNSKGEVVSKDYSELDKYYLETIIPPIINKLKPFEGFVADTLSESAMPEIDNSIMSDPSDLPF